MLRARAALLAETFGALRNCGAGVRECVVYWTGLIDDPGGVDMVVQPPHEAEVDGYRVDDAWVTQFFLDSRTTRRCIRAQVHTHPGRNVRHSATDDAFAVVPSEGFVSIVLPYFATGEISLAGAFAAKLDTAGEWNECAVNDAVRWI